MDLELKRLIRLNEKKRQIRNGWNIQPEEFSINELIEDPMPPIVVEPVSYSRMKGDGNGC